MKLSHIIAIIVIAAAIAIIIATAGDASTYVNFDQAFQMASTGNDTQIHVVGQLKKDDNGHVTHDIQRLAMAEIGGDGRDP